MRRVDGAKGSRVLPRESSRSAERQAAQRCVARDDEQSAEAIVAAAHGGEGPNTRCLRGTDRSMDEQDAVRRDEKPARTSQEAERRASTARDEQAVKGTLGLMEEVVRRENLLAADTDSCGTPTTATST